MWESMYKADRSFHCHKTARTWATQYLHLPDRFVLAEHGIAISYQVILQGIRGGY